MLKEDSLKQFLNYSYDIPFNFMNDLTLEQLERMIAEKKEEENA